MDKKKIIITREILDSELTALSKVFDIIQIKDADDTENILKEHISDASALLCMLSDKIDSKILKQASKLKVIANYAVGFNNIDIDYAREQNIVVTNTPDVLTDATADLAFTLLLNCARNYNQAKSFIEKGYWSKWEAKNLLGIELKGKTLGIYGLGRIGLAVATRAEAFGMKVIYHNRTAKHADYKLVSFEELLHTSDFISLHCPLNEESKMRFGENEFYQMKQNAVFINTARGEMHDEKALYQALKEGHLFAAGLDVTNPEPCSPDSALMKLENCYITPHIGSATFDARNAMAKICAQNILNVLTGKEAITRVN